MSAIPLAWLENQIEDLYRNIQVPPALLETLRPRLKEQLALHNSSRSGEFDQRKTSEQSIKRKQEKLLEAYYDQVLPMELMTREQKQLEHSLSQVQRKLKAF